MRNQKTLTVHTYVIAFKLILFTIKSLSSHSNISWDGIYSSWFLTRLSLGWPIRSDANQSGGSKLWRYQWIGVNTKLVCDMNFEELMVNRLFTTQTIWGRTIHSFPTALEDPVSGQRNQIEPIPICIPWTACYPRVFYFVGLEPIN